MRILILQAGFNEIGVIEELHKMGHYVISIGNQVGLCGQAYVDEYHCLDYSDREAVLTFVKEHDIDRVCACCNDTAVLTADYIAEKLGLDGYDSYESSLIIAHKDKFKEFAGRYDIRTLRAVSFKKEEDALEYVKNAEYPIIVKPVDLSGGKGILRAADADEARVAVKNAFEWSRSGNVVIEPFIEGTQHGFCTFLHNKKVVAYSSNNEHAFVNPYRVEVDTFPADNEEKYADILIEQAERMAELLNLSDGIFHMQYMVSGKEVYILEAMRRIVGNIYAEPSGRSCGFDWDYWEARALIGMDCAGADESRAGDVESVGEKEASCKNDNDSKLDSAPSDMQAGKEASHFTAYRAIIPPSNGRVREIIIDEQLEAYIYRKELFQEPGYVVEHYMTDTLGLLFFEFDSREEMNRIMIDEYDKVRVVMENAGDKK